MHKITFSFLGLLLIAGLVFILGMQRAEREWEQRLTRLHLALDTLTHVTQERADLRNATAIGRSFLHPYPDQPDARWFRAGLPTNNFAAGQPWVDMAPPGDLGLHPPDPVIYRADQPGFWFNPNLGIFRARVRPIPGIRNVELYNQCNQVNLSELPRDTDPARATRRLHAAADPLIDPDEASAPTAAEVEGENVEDEATLTRTYIKTEDGKVEIRIRTPIQVRDRNGRLRDLDLGG